MNADAPIAIRPLGDSALIVEFSAEAPLDVDEVLRVAHLLKRAAIPGVTEITTAFTTVAVFYDPTRVVLAADAALFDSLEAQVRSALAHPSFGEPVGSAPERQSIEIPVCYDDVYALDLAHVGAHARLAPAEVIALHCAAEYRVASVGFTPGFPYLTGLPPQLATPRRATPRAAVPAGSVAIGGSQAGVYPTSSPGGWHVIGRTPMTLFDVTSNPPALLRAGDRVRFRRITAAECRAAAANPLPGTAQATANK